MKILFLSLACCLFFLAAAAHAQTCSVSASSVAFGNYDPFSNTALDTSGSVTVTCEAVVSLLVAYNIKLDAGTGGSFSPRKMTNGSSQLFYQLYSNAGRTTIWGNDTAGTSSVTDGYLLSVLVPVVKTFPVYGRITARQNVGSGTYGDTVTILLSY